MGQSQYLIEITTSKGMTYRSFESGFNFNIEDKIKLVMKSEKCPRRSIVKVVITNVNYALKEK